MEAKIAPRRNTYFVQCFVKLILTLVILFLSSEPAAGQLDLPSMPGPPYPDPRGQNRWGVKFDPRKHGPPYDKRGSSHRNIYQNAPPTRNRINRNQRLTRDSYWSPAKIKSHRTWSRRMKKNSKRSNRYYGNSPHRRRPRTYMQAYKEMEHWDGKRPHLIKPEDKQFWNVWNAWYQKQVDAKANKGKGYVHSQIEPSTQGENEQGAPITYFIDAEEFAKLEETFDDDGKGWGHGGDEKREASGKWKMRKDAILYKMRDMYRKAKSFAFEGEDTAPKNTEESQEAKKSKSEGWKVFTTIGKGIDAANEAMGSVRKTIGGSLLGTGVKYGGKMALDAVMNVGTSALTTAIKSATPLG